MADDGWRWLATLVAGARPATMAINSFGVRQCDTRGKTRLGSMGLTGGGGGRRSYAAAACSRRVDAPLDGVLWDGGAATTTVTAAMPRVLA